MARPKLGKGETQRLHVMISDEELTAIEDWRFANRIGSRSDAVRRLCAIGLLASRDLREINQAANRVLQLAEQQSYEPTPDRLLSEMRSLFLAIEMQHAQLAAYHRDGPFEQRQAAASTGKATVEEQAKQFEEWERQVDASLSALVEPLRQKDDDA